MLPISRILFPVDFSESCAEMIPYVKLIAAKYGAEITLLHVVDPLIGIPDIGIAPPALLPQPRWLISQEAEKLESFGKEELDGFPPGGSCMRAILRCKLLLRREVKNLSLW